MSKASPIQVLIVDDHDMLREGLAAFLRAYPDLKRVETFLLEVAEGRLTGEAIQDQGMAFFGLQGPWYTVGWRMASTIERQLGRPALLACMRDPRQLLPRYNQAATMAGTAGARWSERLMAELGVTERVQPGVSR